MTWKDRIRQMALAGGALSLSACSSAPGTNGIPCGNANPDPCICGRPNASPQAQAECSAKISCETAGGVWNPVSVTDSTTGVTVPPHCERDGGDDGANSTDAQSD